MSQTKKDARRQRILDAALACFSENGFHQTGMAEIVRRSGFSHGAVYVYFQSKDDIIEALAVDRHRQEALLNSVADNSADPIEGLHAMIGVYARYLADPTGEDRRRVGVHGWAEALRNERVRGRVVEGIDAPRSLIGTLVERAKSQKLIANDLNADAVARTLIAFFQGLILQAAWGQSIDIDASIKVIDRMLVGVAPPAPRRPVRPKGRT
jgi:AcrR family transcriptional regulator